MCVTGGEFERLEDTFHDVSFMAQRGGTKESEHVVRAMKGYGCRKVTVRMESGKGASSENQLRGL